MAVLKNGAVPQPLQSAMLKYGNLVTELATDPEIIKAEAVLADARKVLADAEKKYTDKMAEIRTYIESHVLEVGSSAQVGPVKATFRKAHERVSYDRKSIEKICLSNPVVNEMLSPARKVSPVDASASVTIDSKWTPPEPIPNTEFADPAVPF